MRILGLDLIAYGPFANVSLDFSKGKEGLHLVYGDNEAGKSSSLRALLAWLFGIPARTPDNFLHDYDQLRVGGTLQLRRGEKLGFVRRKGNKSTVLEPKTEDVLNDSVLDPFLAGIEEEAFSRLFGIDHLRLVEGGEEILRGAGALGATLFGAAMGTTGLRRILEELQSEADSLFKPRAHKTVVNKALSEYREAKRRAREAGLKVSEWKRLQASLADTKGELAEVEGQLDDVGASLSHHRSLSKAPRIFGKQPKPHVHDCGGSEIVEKKGYFLSMSMMARPCVHVLSIKTGCYP